VGMEINVGLRSDASDLFYRLENASLVVRHHDRDQLGARTKSGAHVVRIDQPLSVHVKVSHFTSALLQTFAGIQHGMMLDLRSNDVIAGMRQPKDSEIVGFRSAAGENDFGS